MTKKANDLQIGGNHYIGEGTQPWDFAWERHYDMYQYSILKYLDRWKKKGGVADLIKAQHFLSKYIELVDARERTQSAEGSPSDTPPSNGPGGADA